MRQPLSAICLTLSTFVLGPFARAETPSFNRDIRPLLSDKCFHCHGPDTNHREADLRLDLEELAHEYAIVPGDAKESDVYARLTSDDPDERMPPPDSNKTLTEAEIELIRCWIDGGAKYESHWAFIPPARGPLPNVKQQNWIRNPIDAYVLAKLEREGLSPSPRADKSTLLRRISLDLTGLPPTLTQLEDFLADDSPTAYEKVVDRLLDSEAYGERMAQVWLDAARYADTMGYQADWERYQWRWRSWVVDAYNRNLPFDEFTIEQLAGDLLPEPTIEQLIATGFNRNHRINDEGGIIPEEYLVEYIIDRVETTAGTWMGLTMGCARCHDHKFDPISQADFYRFFAFFNGVPEKGKEGRKGYADPYMRVARRGRHQAYEDVRSDVARLEAALQHAIANLHTQRERWITETISKLDGAAEPWTIAVPSQLSSDGPAEFERQEDESDHLGMPGDVVDALRKPLASRSKTQQQRLADYHGSLAPETKPARDELSRVKKTLEAFEKDHTTYVMVMREMEDPRETFVLNRGIYDQPGDRVTAGVPDPVLGSLPEGAPDNRLGLAQWLVSGEHPLTARVIVNRYWAMLFGAGLVDTVEDFGLQGSYPSHPELLDWLATEYPRLRWDTKQLLKLMVMSETYAQTSNVSGELQSRDPENRLLARMTRIRLPAETIRDQALFSSGLMVHKLGGPSVKPYQPEGLWRDLSFQDKKRSTDFYEQDSGDGLYRRSLYTFWKRSVPPPAMATFDAPSREMCTLSRSRTNTPLQALALMNDTTYVEASRALAERAIVEVKDDLRGQIQFVFRSLLSRDPSESETQVLTTGFNKRRSFFAGDQEAARKLIAQGESKFDESLDPVELAAMTTCVMTVMNLDETVNRE
jgi:hypothetical protein